MPKQYRIHPKIAVARVGNSLGGFYIGPEETGGLPIACDKNGNPIVVNGRAQHVRQYKDASGAIKRQAARLKIFEHDGDGEGKEVSLGDGNIDRIQWTVHLANKKAVWYNFAELKGDLTFGPHNSYENQHVPLRNPDVTGESDRQQQLIIDPGPRSVDKPGERRQLSVYNIPPTYTHASFPEDAQQDAGIISLGEILMDDEGRLLVLGGFGNSGGPGSITSFAGAEQWFDDVSDGYALATIFFKDGSHVDLEPAWIIVGSPKYAPELVNIITLDDCIFDVAVRFQGFVPDLYDLEKWPDTYGGAGYNPFAGYNPDFEPSYERDIEPIITRPESYRWVANVPSMIDFSRPRFDTSDRSRKTKKQREQYFAHYRIPVPPGKQEHLNIENGPNHLFGKDGVPLMPLNSGDNSVKDFHLVYKFLSLTPTQYFFMKQWSLGKFKKGGEPRKHPFGVTELDRQVIGNCVGGPFSPGIEVTWLMRNPHIYSSPYQLEIAHWNGSNQRLEEYYAGSGLNPKSDPSFEVDGKYMGCEPGDLTKRMAIPWQADFFDCTVQTPNITIPDINQSPADDGIQVPPCYYVYWWPPQSPMFVIAGSLDPGDQVLDGSITNPPIQLPTASSAMNYQTYQVVTNPDVQPMVAAGQQVPYARGIYSFNQMTTAWKDLGFIVNMGTDDYPNFVEKERNTLFIAQGIPLAVK
ncbi:MAG: L-lysine 6-oxidase [Acidobacteriota bacterium]|jgi:L-lysine 6-oxidase|nr:L-lysine 6-oxidase [Acidobacteriota bacterium]